MLWYCDAQLPLPEVHPGTAGHDILWQLPRGHRIHQILTNPCYAGALVYGRTEAQTVIEDGRARQRTRRKKPLEQWRIVLLEQHPGYISWDMFLQNQQLLEANRARPAEAAGGAETRRLDQRRGEGEGVVVGGEEVSARIPLRPHPLRGV